MPFFYYKKGHNFTIAKHRLEDDGPLPDGMVASSKEEYERFVAEKKAEEAQRAASPSFVRAARLSELRSLLADSDYKAIKYAEGLITEEEYAPIKAQRQSWRDEINRLEAE